MSGYYILNPDHTTTPIDDVLEWAKWHAAHQRTDGIVQQTNVGRLWVSTVFLGIDHQFMPGGPPLLFETMIFHRRRSWFRLGMDEQYCDRYSTWDEASLGHLVAIGWALQHQPSLWDMAKAFAANIKQAWWWYNYKRRKQK